MAQTYLVGGAVRDELLGLPVVERDWVVVGATPQEMRAAGYRQVGRDFPVFLHPDTGEEYALARTERKSGHGYHGFSVHAGREVTLEDDLGRRDLTINAMARAGDGTLIDPFGGYADLVARQLRHVSSAFSEDPLRVLRVARFRARLAPFGFTVAAATRELMVAMVAAGELAYLTPERVWREMERALGEPAAECFFDELAGCGALTVILPELASRWGRSACYARAALLAAKASAEPAVRFAAACHELDPATEVAALRHRLPLPKQTARLVERVAAGWPAFAALNPGDGDAAWELLDSQGALKRPEEFEQQLAAWSAASRARGGEPQARLAALRRARVVADSIRGADLARDGWQGPELGAELARQRRRAIRRALAGSPE